MKDRTIIVMSIVLVTLTSGCLGLGGNESEDFGSENLSVEEVREQSSLNDLSNFSSYTVNLSVVAGNSSESAEIFSVYEEINRTSERAYSDSSIFLNQSKYTSDGVTYSKTQSPLGNGSAQYEKSTEPYNESDVKPATNDSTFEQTDNISETIGNLILEKQNYTTYDGRDVAVYSNTSTGNFSQTLTDQNVTFTKRDFTAYMLEDSSIPLYKVEYSGSRQDTNESTTFNIVAELRDVNSTTVTEPSWISEVNSNS